MDLLIVALVVLIALQHFGFMVLEAVLWTKPIGLKVFRNTPEKAKVLQVLAANQGLYNGFLAAGLLWSAFAPAPLGTSLKYFFLGCVSLAGLVGGLTFSRRILWIQGAPAFLTLILALGAL